MGLLYLFLHFFACLFSVALITLVVMNRVDCEILQSRFSRYSDTLTCTDCYRLSFLYEMFILDKTPHRHHDTACNYNTYSSLKKYAKYKKTTQIPEINTLRTGAGVHLNCLNARSRGF